MIPILKKIAEKMNFLNRTNSPSHKQKQKNTAGDNIGRDQFVFNINNTNSSDADLKDNQKKTSFIKIAEEEIEVEEKMISLSMDVVKINAHDHFAGVQAEHVWINKRYPGNEFCMQFVDKQEFKSKDNKKKVVNFDVIQIKLSNGRQKVIYFEIDSFFSPGKPTSAQSGYAEMKLKEIYS